MSRSAASCSSPRYVARRADRRARRPLFSKFFDPPGISPGKLDFAVSDKPIVSQNHLGQGVVLIATNPLEGNKWPDDLQVML